MSSFLEVMGSVPTGRRSESEVTAASVSIKKNDRVRLGTSDRLKLAKAAKEGGTDKFTFFASDGKLVNDFQTVYDLHMRIEALSKALTSYDMLDVFQVIPQETILRLSSALDLLFDCQSDEEQAATALALNPTDTVLVATNSTRIRATARAESQLSAIKINSVNLITSFQDLDETAIRQSNRYYAMYGSPATVENLSWSGERCLETCEDALKDKIREQLVGVSVLENGGPLVLKLALDLVMDIDDSALRALTQNL